LCHIVSCESPYSPQACWNVSQMHPLTVCRYWKMVVPIVPACLDSIVRHLEHLE
jgi:hypothetical protein